MKACVLPAPQAPLLILDVETPSPGPGQVLVRIEACGVCHSDVFLASSPKLPRTPLILGHEAVGRISELGPGVTRFQVGDRVGIAFLHHSCGHCSFCKSGRENYCLSQQQTGYHVDGALAEYAVADERFVARVPDAMPAIQAAPLCCAGLTAYKAVRTANLAAGEWIALFGAGGLGHLAIQLAKQAGLQVAVIDVAADKLEMARQLGADLLINGATEDPRKVLAGHVPDGGVAGAITLTGSLAAIEQAFPCLRPNGILVLVGLCTKRYDLQVLRMVMQGLRISGILVGTPRDLQEIVDLAATGTPHVHAEACGLEDVPAVMERMRQGNIAGRMVVQF
jgi:propanol-preferring alcohol dehydrogenase